MNNFIQVVGFFTVIFLCIWFISTKQKKNKKEKELESHVSNLKHSNQNQVITNFDISKALVFDEKDKKIFSLQYDSSDTIMERVFSYNDLLSVAIIEDGETLTNTVRSSQLGGALIGGLAFGGVGAIIGGLSGKTKSSETVNKITLRLTVNDTNNPLFEIDVLNCEAEYRAPVKKNYVLYQNAMQKARHWHGLIEVLVKRADIEDKENEKNNISQNSSNSIADELKKLAELRDAGVLSDAEFKEYKERLLT